MKKAFVSGPYRAPSESGVHNNIQRAREVSERLWQAGYAVYCPHLNSAHMGGLVPDAQFLQACLVWLPHTDIIVMVDGWEGSAGARMERDLALRLFIPAYSEHNFPGGEFA